MERGPNDSFRGSEWVLGNFEVIFLGVFKLSDRPRLAFSNTNLISACSMVFAVLSFTGLNNLPRPITPSQWSQCHVWPFSNLGESDQDIWPEIDREEPQTTLPLYGLCQLYIKLPKKLGENNSHLHICDSLAWAATRTCQDLFLV